MNIEYDPDKNQINIKNRGLSFDLVEQFEWGTSLIWEDDRNRYGEIRFSALGYIGFRIYHLVFTHRDEVVRVISFRKANKREVNRYAKP